MLDAILAVVEVAPGVLMAVAMLVAYVFIFALVIICLIRVARYFGNAGKEQKLIRLKLGKVAEEVHLLRQELKGEKNSRPSSQ